MAQTLFIRNLTHEELEIINLLKRETASATMSKAVRKGLVCYRRILDDFKECAQENVELRIRIRKLEKVIETINDLSKPPKETN